MRRADADRKTFATLLLTKKLFGKALRFIYPGDINNIVATGHSSTGDKKIQHGHVIDDMLIRCKK